MRFALLLGFCASLLAVVLLAAFVLRPPWSWAVGLVYIGYDTWLLFHMVRASRRAVAAPLRLASGGPRPTLAVVIAARNEREILPQALDAILSQADLPDELLIVDDGSTDGTREMLERDYAPRSPLLRVLAKEASGKARSLNEALAQVTSDLFVTIDADTVLDAGALGALRAAFQNEPDLAAACGVLRPRCRPSAFSRAFELYQTFEYLRGFLWRVVWSCEDTLVLVSGAFAAFRRERLVEVGGFDPLSLVEDYELMFRLHRRSLEERGSPLHARVIGDARAITDCPGRLNLFLKQRTRWFAGYLETMFQSAKMVGNRRYGRLGTFHLPLKTVDMLLPVFGLAAIVALLVQLAVGQRPGGVVLFALLFKFSFDLSCHFYALVLHARWLKKRITPGFALRAIAATLTEPVGFQLVRQFGALLGWLAFLRGRIEWTPQRERTPELPRVT